MKKKFMDECKQNGNKWCLIVREMDNPVLGVREQDDLSEIVMGAASGAARATACRCWCIAWTWPMDGNR